MQLAPVAPTIREPARGLPDATSTPSCWSCYAITGRFGASCADRKPVSPVRGMRHAIQPLGRLMQKGHTIQISGADRSEQNPGGGRGSRRLRDGVHRLLLRHGLGLPGLGGLALLRRADRALPPSPWCSGPGTPPACPACIPCQAGAGAGRGRPTARRPRPPRRPGPRPPPYRRRRPTGGASARDGDAANAAGDGAREADAGRRGGNRRRGRRHLPTWCTRRASRRRRRPQHAVVFTEHVSLLDCSGDPTMDRMRHSLVARGRSERVTGSTVRPIAETLRPQSERANESPAEKRRGSTNGSFE